MNPFQFTPEEIEADPVLHGMQRDQLPLTRENYVIRNWGDIPEEWSAEDESGLPDKMQNWDQFENQ